MGGSETARRDPTLLFDEGRSPQRGKARPEEQFGHELLAPRAVPSFHQAVHSLRSLVLRRSAYCEQAWELSSVQPAGSKAIGMYARMGPIERGGCELELRAAR